MNKNLPFSFFFYVSSFFMFMFSPHWFTIWVCLELNTLMVVSFMMKNKKEMESALIYFLTQSMSSMAIIFFIFTSNSDNTLHTISIVSTVLVMCFLYKMGATPFSSWFMSISMNINTFMFFVMLTLQKIMPFMLFMFTTPAGMWEVVIVMMLSLTLGSIMNFTASNLKMILIFSSVSHSGWFLLALNMNTSLWVFYFFLYTVIIYSLMNIIPSNSKTNFLQSKSTQITLMLSMMTLAGLPPLVMFIPKVSLISMSSSYSMYLTVLLLIFSSMLDFFIYLRISYSLSLLHSCKIMFFKQKMMNPLIIIMGSAMSTMSLSMF